MKEDGSDCLLPECLRHKYSQVAAWMFHSTIVDGKKGPDTFREKEHILLVIDQFFNKHVLDGYIFWQENAPSHASFKIRLEILRRRIPTIKAPPYSPDLSLFEHV